MNESYVDPTSKYYIDRLWEEYHTVKEELADTKCKLGQLEDYVDKVLKLELAETKLKLKMAQSAWDELDKSHAARAMLHDELVIAEGQRDQARAERDALRTALRRCDRTCETVMHRELERHGLGERCPVVGLIDAALAVQQQRGTHES